jgi:hypothetical protein
MMEFAYDAVGTPTLVAVAGLVVTKFCVTDLPRRELAKALARCKDEAKLTAWLAAEVKAGNMCCALMVQARFSAIRRAREIRDLKYAVMINQMTEVSGR